MIFIYAVRHHYTQYIVFFIDSWLPAHAIFNRNGRVSINVPQKIASLIKFASSIKDERRYRFRRKRRSRFRFKALPRLGRIQIVQTITLL